MTSERRSPSPEFTVDDDGGRPLITSSGQTNKYRPGQVVYLVVSGSTQREGPYKIATPAGQGNYTLCFADGSQAKNGAAVDESLMRDAP
ncbi:hypothetical protein CC86DRAFT_472104 [Ophiobolus disseminans]|uniref:Uncharacterized protein n=1 Tax=Ophiobolus disseminans TaxID=1469910 RepID=A0A6A6ZEX6_9PLEO|nr:hypothetical protein CC86DRAFT_472104 [Ophiobolus disseminans]